MVGFALFGVTTYLPLFLQVANGASPTTSGLRLVPLMLGVLTTSLVSGQLITSFGRYKAFPIVGTALMVLGLFLLSRMNEHTSVLVASLYMLVLGLGLGLVMQVLVIAVQNAAYHDSLAELLEGWSPEQEAELAMLLRRVTTQLLHTDTRKAFVSPSD